MTYAATLTNDIKNIETMLTPKSTEVADADFSNVLDKKVYTIGDMKHQTIDKSDKLADFKEFLSQATSEAYVETSLDLTLSKDITETIENQTSDTEETAETETDASSILLFAQALETANQVTTATEPLQSEITDAAETAPEVEVAETKPTEENIDDAVLDEDMLQELNIESIESETSSSNNNSSLLNHQTAEEQGIKIALHNETGIKSFEVQASKAPQQSLETTPDKIIEQVTKQLERLQNTSKVSIVLNPESLGKVTIQLVKSPEGLSAQFTTATQEARNILMKGLDGLKETLLSHGVGVDNVSVKISDAQKSEYNADWTDQEGSRGGNKEQNPQNRREKEQGLFDRMMKREVNGE